MRADVAIIGGGPAGLFLALLLQREGIEPVVIEKRSREHVLARVRAGVLEQGTTELMRDLGIAAALDARGKIHGGVNFAFGGHVHRLDLAAHTGGKTVTVYGQTEVTRDLYDAADARGITVVHEADHVTLEGLDGGGVGEATASFSTRAGRFEVTARFIAGCDGFHGVSRQSIPGDKLATFERVYPFGWLGVLSETPPVAEELIYACHPRGFALCSMRSSALSRHYLQVPSD
ncbi:MAG: FAD-dependent monooxygenase, partial [Pseudomonadota bacterium]